LVRLLVDRFAVLALEQEVGELGRANEAAGVGGQDSVWSHGAPSHELVRSAPELSRAAGPPSACRLVSFLCNAAYAVQRQPAQTVRLTKSHGGVTPGSTNNLCGPVD